MKARQRLLAALAADFFTGGFEGLLAFAGFALADLVAGALPCAFVDFLAAAFTGVLAAGFTAGLPCNEPALFEDLLLGGAAAGLWAGALAGAGLALLAAAAFAPLAAGFGADAALGFASDFG